MPNVIFRTSRLADFWLSAAYRLEPPCSMYPEVKGGYIRDRLNVHVAGNAGRILERSAIKIGDWSGNGVHPVERERLRKGSA